MSYIYQNLGEKLSIEEIEGLLDEADGDGEGFINYSEFCSIKNLMWKQIIKSSIKSLEGHDSYITQLLAFSS